MNNPQYNDGEGMGKRRREKIHKQTTPRYIENYTFQLMTYFLEKVYPIMMVM
jgi:hypothetical protein